MPLDQEPEQVEGALEGGARVCGDEAEVRICEATLSRTEEDCGRDAIETYHPNRLGMFRDYRLPSEFFWTARVDLGLLSLHCFIQCELAAFFYGNHAMNVFVSRHGDVDDIVSRIQIEPKRRRLIQNSIIHRNLRALGLSFDVHSTHASRVPATE